MAMYDTQDHHGILRLHTALEIALYPAWYDAHHPSFRSTLQDDEAVIFPTNDVMCQEVTTDGSYSDAPTVSALSAVLQVPIDMYFPPLDHSALHPLTKTIVGQEVNPGREPICIMWSTSGNVPRRGDVNINHFVPLIDYLARPTDDEAPDVNSDVDRDEASRDASMTNDEAPDVDRDVNLDESSLIEDDPNTYATDNLAAETPMKWF